MNNRHLSVIVLALAIPSCCPAVQNSERSEVRDLRYDLKRILDARIEELRTDFLFIRQDPDDPRYRAPEDRHPYDIREFILCDEEVTFVCANERRASIWVKYGSTTNVYHDSTDTETINGSCVSFYAKTDEQCGLFKSTPIGSTVQLRYGDEGCSLTMTRWAQDYITIDEQGFGCRTIQHKKTLKYPIDDNGQRDLLESGLPTSLVFSLK
jgi:hypothetical protein